MRRVALILAMFCSIQMIGQQEIPLTRQAARECRRGDLTDALKTIAKATDSEESTHPFCWYVKGYIHKQVFVEEEKESPTSENREAAILAIEKSIAIDEKGEYTDNCLKALRFLAVTYYNDAIYSTMSFSPSDPKQPVRAFERFKEVMAMADATYDFKSNTIDFYKHMGSGYIRHFNSSDRKDRDMMEASIRYYKMALAMHPEDYESNYNLAINYYNLGVQRIKRINHNTDIFELLSIQDECVILFEQSLPYMLEAQRQNPDRIDTLKGLMAIYRALSDHEKSVYYQNELRKLANNK